jgi:hypothetical protein
MGATIHKLVRNTAVLLLLVSLSGFLPVAAHAQHLVRLGNSSPVEEGPPVKAEELKSDAEHATLSKRLRQPRSRAKNRYLAAWPGFILAPVRTKPGLSADRTLTRPADAFSEQLPPLRC